MNEPNLEEFVTSKEVADHFKVSNYTFQTWVRHGIVPPTAYVKIGGVYRFRISDVVRALTAHIPDPMDGYDPMEDADNPQLSFNFDEPASVDNDI